MYYFCICFVIAVRVGTLWNTQDNLESYWAPKSVSTEATGVWWVPLISRKTHAIYDCSLVVMLHSHKLATM